MRTSDQIDWRSLAGDSAHLVRPETASKYFPKNPLRQTILSRFLAAVGDALELRPWSTLLDVGCGEGFVDHYLTRRFPGRSLIGIEPDRAPLLVATHINPSVGYLHADGRRLPFNDGDFDAVICLEVLEHLRDYRSMLTELGRVSTSLRVVSVPCRPWYQGMRFLTGKSWSRLGEHEDHVVSFNRRVLERDLNEAWGPNSRVVLAVPWIIGIHPG